MSADGDILSQDEIDALLKGVDSGAVDTEPAQQAAALPYNMSKHVRIVRGRMPTLEMVNDRLARQLRVGIYNMIRRTPDVAVVPVQVHRFSEYMQTLHLPASLNLVKFGPLRGTGLVVFDSQLVFAMVDNFFGGFGRNSRIEGRDFTPTESRVIQMLLQQVLVDMQAAWSPVLRLQPEYLSSETNPTFVSIAAPGEVVVVTAFRIELEGGGSGELHLTMPYSMLEPIREMLDSGFQTDRPERDSRWGQQLRAQVENIEVNMVPVLGQSSLTVERLLNLKPGDMLPCDFEGQVTLFAEGIPAARGKYCTSRGKQAVQVNELLLTGGS